MDVARLHESLKRRRQIAVPDAETFAIAPLEKTGMPDVLSDVLRVFSAIKFERGRRPSKYYDPDFDFHKHVLSDSPTSITHFMGKDDWNDYKVHAIVQIGICNFRCFYCYVDYKYLSGQSVVNVSAAKIVDEFLHKRNDLAKSGVKLNVLRISGGEPLLVPDLTLKCLDLIREKGLSDEICIKTETNLSPLVPDSTGTSLFEQWVDVDRLKEHHNFIMHPTFHGINKDSLERISTAKWDSYEMMEAALRKLIELEIEFFPSFGSNVVSTEEVADFFRFCKGVHKNLPGRIAVRKFDLGYSAPQARKNGQRDVQTYDQTAVLELWNSLMKQEYSVGYGEVPRHKFALYS